MHRYTRNWSGQQAIEGVSADAVRTVLEAGGGRWVEAFLDATEAATWPADPGGDGPSLDWSGQAEDGARRFVWVPKRDPRLFRRFYGQFGVDAAPGGALLTLDGTWFDGRASVNEAALDGLLVRLGAALEEVFEHRPRRRGLGASEAGSASSVDA